jgi:hypothetical protein
VGATIEVAVGFYPMTDHLDPAILADRGERVNRALETVEGVRVPAGHAYLKSFIVVISADFALDHIYLLLLETERFPILKVNTLDLAGTNARHEDARSLPLV